MKERGIPFMAPMVRAVQDDTKTKTRRIVATQPTGIPDVAKMYKDRACKKPVMAAIWDKPAADGSTCCHCPYGVPGDRLWVREHWRTYATLDTLPPREIQPGAGIQYEAGGTNVHTAPVSLHGMGKFRPGMFMPRWASRILLEIVSVRVERLQDISEADAIAEGCTKNHNGYYWGGPHAVSGLKQFPTAVDAYRDLWESINGASSWDANPWVWVVEFKVVKS